MELGFWLLLNSRDKFEYWRFLKSWLIWSFGGYWEGPDLGWSVGRRAWGLCRFVLYGKHPRERLVHAEDKDLVRHGKFTFRPVEGAAHGRRTTAHQVKCRQLSCFRLFIDCDFFTCCVEISKRRDLRHTWYWERYTWRTRMCNWNIVWKDRGPSWHFNVSRDPGRVVVIGPWVSVSGTHRKWLPVLVWVSPLFSVRYLLFYKKSSACEDAERLFHILSFVREAFPQKRGQQNTSTI